MIEDERKAHLSSLAVVADYGEGLGVEDWIFEENGSACTEDVLIIGDEEISLLRV